MNKRLRVIMLIDDNEDENYFHERAIQRSVQAEAILKFKLAEEALSHLQSAGRDPSLVFPDLIFLDINMPRMNGWEFLSEYEKANLHTEKPVVIIMLTNSDDPDDQARARSWSHVAEYRTKPLTTGTLKEIKEKYFPEG